MPVPLAVPIGLTALSTVAQLGSAFSSSSREKTRQRRVNSAYNRYYGQNQAIYQGLSDDLADAAKARDAAVLGYHQAMSDGTKAAAQGAVQGEAQAGLDAALEKMTGQGPAGRTSSAGSAAGAASGKTGEMKQQLESIFAALAQQRGGALFDAGTNPVLEQLQIAQGAGNANLQASSDSAVAQNQLQQRLASLGSNTPSGLEQFLNILGPTAGAAASITGQFTGPASAENLGQGAVDGAIAGAVPTVATQTIPQAAQYTQLPSLQNQFPWMQGQQPTTLGRIFDMRG